MFDDLTRCDHPCAVHRSVEEARACYRNGMRDGDPGHAHLRGADGRCIVCGAQSVVIVEMVLILTPEVIGKGN